MIVILVLRSCNHNEIYQKSGDRFDEGKKSTFHGYECLEDCSGHEAGYEWAEENDIDDIDACDGNSNSFNEGCQAYVKENADSSDDYDGDNENDDSFDDNNDDD